MRRELLNKFEGVLEVAKEVFENMLKELRSPERYQLFPKEGRNTSEDVPL